jgi:V/A-type H+-transporting ATPase subunit C
LKIIENSDDLRSAATQMRRKSFGSSLMALPDDARLSDYEDALDRHYFSNAIKSLTSTKPSTRYLRNYLAMEIDNRNILNILEAESVGLSAEDISELLIPGGRLLPSSSFSSIAAGGKDSMMDILRSSSRFDFAEFEQLISRSRDVRSLDPVITWLKNQEHNFMQRMSYLHPVSALPIIHYICMKVQEVADLRIIVRGRLAGLPEDVLEAHIM